MAAPDIIVISSNNYDVYELRATADIYFNAKLGNTSWKDASGADKDKALVSSTRLLELQAYLGVVTDTTTPQPLLWPRTGITDRQGIAVLNSVIPDDILSAYYELAQAFIDDTELANTGNQDDNTKRVKAGDVEAEFFTGNFNTGRFPNQVDELIRPYLDGAGLGVGAFASGTDGKSSFCPPDQYERDEGFA